MFWDNFAYLCKINNLTPNGVAKSFGLSNAAATQWKKGNLPKISLLQQVSRYFDVSIDWLLSDHEAIKSDSIAIVPEFSTASAGLGSFADNQILDYIPLVRFEGDMRFSSESLIAIRVKGDSMLPKIESGNTVIIDKDSKYENGDVVVAIWNEEGYVKEYHLSNTKDELILHSLNSNYKDLCFYKNDINDVHILGKVIAVYKFF